MKKNFVLYVMCVVLSPALAQQINWAKTINLPYNSNGMVTDAASNIYHYGASAYFNFDYMTPGNDNGGGSYLYKYSPDGTFLVPKSWSGSFYIKNMIYDGAQAFYFTGYFSGTQTIDGISISSKGNSDGMVGKMNLAGTVTWISTFGGAGEDVGTSITFNTSKTQVIVGGEVSDSLFVNNNYVKHGGGKSMLLAAFNLNSSYANAKLYNFISYRNEVNAAVELKADNAGNYLVHGIREGRHWYDDTIKAAEEGHYVFKMDAQFNLLWEKFIINGGCYYGYSCDGLSVADNGDALITSYCSGKYGGNPTVKRLNSGTGDENWTIPNNKDGEYNYTYTSGSDFFVLGIEGQDGCPCEEGHMGYNVIKKFNSNNRLAGETRINRTYMRQVIKAPNGKLYVYGSGFQKTVVGQDTVNGLFMAELGDVYCRAVAVDKLPYYWKNKLFCDTIMLDAGAGYSNYLWSDGSTGRYLATSVSGTYRVKVTEQSGCVVYSLGSNVEKRTAPASSNIYYVSNNIQQNKNVIKWTIDTDNGMTQTRIIRKTSKTNVSTELIQNTNWEMYYVDSLGWSDTSAVHYSIVMIDECGNESPESPWHTPMHLKAERNGNNVSLNWNKYIGFDYPSFTILKGASLSNMHPIATLGNAQTSFTDTNVPRNSYYQIMISSSNFGPVYSNYVTVPVGTGNSQASKNDSLMYSIFPNPSDNAFNVRILNTELKNITIRVFDLGGNTVYNAAIPASKGEVRQDVAFTGVAGIYVMEVDDGVNKERSKIIKK